MRLSNRTPVLGVRSLQVVKMFEQLFDMPVGGLLRDQISVPINTPNDMPLIQVNHFCRAYSNVHAYL